MTDSHLGMYELVKPLGQGGMADIFLARIRGLDTHPVALKVLNPQRGGDDEARALFVDEARVAALLDHPNIAAHHGLSVVDGHHVLALEYIDGADLRHVLQTTHLTGSEIPFETALSIVIAAAAGLDHAHRRCDAAGRPLHLVHRDVSLSNIMIGHDGTVKIVDFGIAQSTIATVHTAPGIVRGKASYMSPEQCRGDAVDLRTDVFALGIVLYELTTGARCFAGKTDFDRMVAVVRGEYIAPSDLVADYPPELEAIVRTALAGAPEGRFPSCAAMIDALERVMRARGWIGGPAAIRDLMSDLFGADQLVTSVDESPATEIHEIVTPVVTTRITRPTRFPRGSVMDMVPLAAVDEDALTRRPRALRTAPAAAHLAA